MKQFTLFSIFILMSCCPKKNDVAAIASKIEATNACPEDGVCTSKIIRNKKLVIKTDELGHMSYQLQDNTSSSVVFYEYDRKVEKDIQDGNYKEEVIFEIANTTKQINLKDGELQRTKMIFGRFCYCKGYTGYFKVTSGNLDLNLKDQQATVTLNFKVAEVPQILDTLQFTTN